MGNAYWTCDMDSYTYSTDSLLWWHLMIIIKFDETHLSATIEHLFLVVKRVTCYFGQWEERQIFLSVTTDQPWKPNSRVKLIGWWEILSWICKNPCRMHYIVQLPHVFCTQDTHAAQRQQHTDMSKYFWTRLCMPGILPSWHLTIVNGTTVFYKKQHGRYLKTRPWCSHGISVRDFKVENVKSSQSLGVRYCAAKSEHVSQGIMMSLSRRMIDLVIPTTFPSSSSSWSSSSFLENLPKNGKKRFKLNTEVRRWAFSKTSLVEVSLEKSIFVKSDKRLVFGSFSHSKN